MFQKKIDFQKIQGLVDAAQSSDDAGEDELAESILLKLANFILEDQKK